MVKKWGYLPCKWWDNWCIKPVDMISLSHYLQGLGYFQTVVGNGISEPSTVPIQCCSLIESWGKSKNGSCCLVYFRPVMQYFHVFSCSSYSAFFWQSLWRKQKRTHRWSLDIRSLGMWDAQKLEDRLGTTAENGSYAASRKTNLKILFCG